MVSNGIIGVLDGAIGIREGSVDRALETLCGSTQQGFHLQLVGEGVKAADVAATHGGARQRGGRTLGHRSIRAIRRILRSGGKADGNGGTSDCIVTTGIRIRSQRKCSGCRSCPLCECCLGVLGGGIANIRSGDRWSGGQGLGKALVYRHHGDGSGT